MTENDWSLLLGRIAEGNCTPFLGAGINGGLLPTGKDIARDWAKEHGYPLLSTDELDQGL